MPAYHSACPLEATLCATASHMAAGTWQRPYNQVYGRSTKVMPTRAIAHMALCLPCSGGYGQHGQPGAADVLASFGGNAYMETLLGQQQAVAQNLAAAATAVRQHSSELPDPAEWDPLFRCGPCIRLLACPNRRLVAGRSCCDSSSLRSDLSWKRLHRSMPCVKSSRHHLLQRPAKTSPTHQTNSQDQRA